MSIESLNCPNCGASLQVDTEADVVICSYCNSSIKIKKSPSMTDLSIEDSESGEVSSELLEEIKRLLQKGKKIEAIKLYRHHSKKSLKQSKDYVESIAAQNNIQLKSSALSTSSCLTLVIIVLIWPFIVGVVTVIVGELIKNFYGHSLSPQTINNIQAFTGASIIILSIVFFIIWIYRRNKKKDRDDRDT